MPPVENLCRWSREDRLAIFQQTAASVGIASPISIEKDYWVYWILKIIFNSPERSDLVFKGGTSLSKVYRIIKRFSEDIDLSVDRNALGFEGDRDPENAGSMTQAAKLLMEIRRECSKWVSTTLAEDLRRDISNELQHDQWSLISDPTDEATLLFEYPYALEPTAYAGASYIRPVIRLEFGGRNDVWPSESGEVKPYCLEAFPEAVPDPPAIVTVLSAERTFWEKATLVHAEFYRPADKSLGDRVSRHYYDLVMLDRSGVAQAAIEQEDLRKAVVEHKTVFFPSHWARYDLANPGTFRISPHPALEKALRADFRMMEEMFFEEPPSFDELLVALKDLENRINASK